MKTFLFALFVLFFFLKANAQKEEEFHIDWPIEYNWKIVKQKESDSEKYVMIIPRNETPENASILGSIKAYNNLTPNNLDSIIWWYRSLLDTGSTLTVIERNDRPKSLWVIFKIETVETPKYPIPESDLYYFRQGKYALYENFVAIKTSHFEQVFLDKWIGILKTAKITMRKL